MNFKNSKIVLKNIKTNSIVSVLNLPDLHQFILSKVSIEFSEMVSSCYYPKIANLYKELLHKTSSKESELINYSKEKYKILPHAKNKNLYKLLYDPFTTLLLIIVQEFLKQKDISGAEAAYHLFALRFYTNLLYKYTISKSGGSRQPLCVPEYFKTALDRLSKNHIFNTKKTIANSIMYFSRITFQKYLKDIQKDDANKIAYMIYEIRSKINQSMRSFFAHYYEASKAKGSSQTEEQEWDESHETQLKHFISVLVRDICVYKKIDSSAMENSFKETKFNKKIGALYIKELSNPKYSDNINIAYYLLLKNNKDLSIIKSDDFIKYIKTLMSIKTTKQPVYFKKSISTIHHQIIENLNLSTWYNKLSIQSQAISRNFISYYLAFFLRKYI